MTNKTEFAIRTLGGVSSIIGGLIVVVISAIDYKDKAKK